MVSPPSDGNGWVRIESARMRTISAAVVMASALLCAGTASAQTMTVREFLTTADRIPRNPTALLRSHTRRLLREIERAGETLKTEYDVAVAADRQPAYCRPARVRIGADELLTRFNSIPESRRSISVTQAMREWMIARYPCPAA